MGAASEPGGCRRRQTGGKLWRLRAPPPPSASVTAPAAQGSGRHSLYGSPETQQRTEALAPSHDEAAVHHFSKSHHV